MQQNHYPLPRYLFTRPAVERATLLPGYNHGGLECTPFCSGETCRKAYGRALGLEARERRNAEDAAVYEADRQWRDGSLYGSP